MGNATATPAVECNTWDDVDRLLADKWQSTFRYLCWPIIETVYAHTDECNDGRGTVKRGIVFPDSFTPNDVYQEGLILITDLIKDLDNAFMSGANAWLQNWPMTRHCWTPEESKFGRMKLSFRGCPVAIPDGFDIERARKELLRSISLSDEEAQYGCDLRGVIYMSGVQEGEFYPFTDKARHDG